MYENGCSCGCSGNCELYRGDMYDVCRARLGSPHGETALKIRLVLLGAVIALTAVLLVSCCLK